MGLLLAGNVGLLLSDFRLLLPLADGGSHGLEMAPKAAEDLCEGRARRARVAALRGEVERWWREGREDEEHTQ